MTFTKEPYLKLCKKYLTDRQQKLITHDYIMLERIYQKIINFINNKQYISCSMPGNSKKTGILMQINEEFRYYTFKKSYSSFTNDEKKKFY